MMFAGLGELDRETNGGELGEELQPDRSGYYVLRQTDFGFLWLDTSTLTAGHVEAEGYCISSPPPANSNLYVVGDCNGISVIASLGAVGTLG